MISLERSRRSLCYDQARQSTQRRGREEDHAPMRLAATTRARVTTARRVAAVLEELAEEVVAATLAVSMAARAAMAVVVAATAAALLTTHILHSVPAALLIATRNHPQRPLRLQRQLPHYST